MFNLIIGVDMRSSMNNYDGASIDDQELSYVWILFNILLTFLIIFLIQLLTLIIRLNYKFRTSNVPKQVILTRLFVTTLLLVNVI